MLQLRRYQPQDNITVKALHHTGLKQFGADADPFYDSDLDDIEDTYINNRGDFLVGLCNNEIVGIGAIRKLSETCGEIKRIRVRLDCQRKGFAQTILINLIDIAIKSGYTELRLDTTDDNIPARRLFEKFGFQENERRKVGTYNIVFYGKSLASTDNE